MALAHLLLLSFVLPSLEALSNSSTFLSHEGNHTMQAMIQQVCVDLADPESCFSNFRREYELLGLKSPAAVLSAAIKASIVEANQAMNVVNKFANSPTTPLEKIAIQDCMELLDMSVYELSCSLGKTEKMIDVCYDSSLHAWLSAALGNQDTCLEGFDGTDGRISDCIKGSIYQVTQLISNVLALYHKMLHGFPMSETPVYDPEDEGSSDDFPPWMTGQDRDLLMAGPNGEHVDIIVAQDGSGNFTSIMEAVNQAPDYSPTRYTIYVKEGVYEEIVDLNKKKQNILLMGQQMDTTVISGNRSVVQGWTTFRSATFAVTGQGFIAMFITFRNTAGAENHQAVALRVDSDKSAFYNCSIEGYQDTLYSHSLRQFFRRCRIFGTVDYIFGNGQAVFQNCFIETNQPLPQQQVTITAHGRANWTQSTGFSLQDCRVEATYPAYLGRPWKKYSRTVFMGTYLSDMVQPEGWLEWNGSFALSTLYYGEYENGGPEWLPERRIRWPGFHLIPNNDARTVYFFSVDFFIDGLSWLPATGIEFTTFRSIFKPYPT